MNIKSNHLLLPLFLLGFAASSVSCAYDEKEGDYGVTYEQIHQEPERFFGKTIAFQSYVLFTGHTLKLYQNLSAMNSTEGALPPLKVEESEWDKLKPFNGCLVSMRTSLKQHPRNKEIFLVSDVQTPTPNGLLYHMAAGQMNEKGIKGKPRCLGQAIMDLMATPK